MANVVDFEQDLQELQSLLTKIERAHNKKLINTEIKRLEDVIERKKFDNCIAANTTATTNSTKSEDPDSPKSTVIKRYEVQLKEYAWDQTPKFLKLFITDINGADKLDKNNVTVTYTESSFILKAIDLKGKDYKFEINRLLHPIDPEQSYHKCKSDMIVIFCKKVKPEQTWDCLTTTAKRLKQVEEADKDEPMDNADNPSAGLMNIMKKMYDKGDSETKRMISKAWYEGQQKQNTLDSASPNFDDL